MPTQPQRTAPEGVSATDARKDFAEILNRAVYGEERIIITRHGEALAALVSAKRLKELEAIEDAMDGHAAEKAAEQGTFMDAQAFFADMDDDA